MFKIAQLRYVIESWFKRQSIENSKLNKRRGLREPPLELGNGGFSQNQLSVTPSRH